MSELSDKLWAAAKKNDDGSFQLHPPHPGCLSRSSFDAVIAALSTIADITPKPDPCEVACQKAWDGLAKHGSDPAIAIVSTQWGVSRGAFWAAFRLGYEAKGAT